MLLRLLASISIFLFYSALVAQTGAPKTVYLYYKITSSEALELLEQKYFNPSSKYFHTAIEAPSSAIIAYSELPIGNYLRISNQLENLEVELLLQASAEVDIMDAKKYLYFNPVNIPETEKRSSQIWLDGKLLNWHEATRQFRWKKKRRKKEMKMVAKFGDQVVYKNLNQKYNSRNLRNVWRKLNPIRWSRNLWNRLIWRIHKIKNPSYGGYIVLNKPEYRPGDTLKMKAYFVDKKGRYPKGPLQLGPLDYSKANLKSGPLFPDKNGNITYEFILHDSLELRLNRSYSINFQGRYFSGFKARFQYKDYQLDEVSYKFNAEQSSFFYGDTVKFTANAMYKNGLRVKDAKLKILLLPPERFVSTATPHLFFKEEVTVRDTLWTWEQPLDLRKPTEIIIPDSILPAANFNYRVIADFTNANGEIQTIKRNFRLKEKLVPDELTCFKVALEGLELVVQNNCLDRPDLHQVVIKNTLDNGSDDRKILLPFREKIDHQFYDWKFFDQDSILIKSFDLKNQSAEVKITGEHQGDSIIVTIQNPRGLPLLWEWYENKKLKTAATAIPTGDYFSRKADRKKSYYLKYFYKWNGQILTKQLDLKFYKNQLEMEVIQPKIIQPGETVSVKVKVKDGKGKKAANVNLTALSINDQFANNRISGPSIQVGPFKKPKEKLGYRINSGRKKITKNLNQSWLNKLDISNQLFYKIRHAHQTVFLQYEKIEGDSFYQEIAQFAPYIINDGKSQPILMIKANRELVYYHDVDDNPPYSFIGAAGKNKITIRTKEYEYTLNGVELKKGYKLEISIDEDRFQKNHNSKNKFWAKRKSMPNHWTSSELNLIKKSIFVLRNNPKDWSNEISISQGNRRIHFINKRSNFLKIGPFRNQNIQFHSKQKRGRFQSKKEPFNFRFDPGFSHQITPDRDRLYEYKFSKNIAPHKSTIQYPLQLVYTTTDLRKFNWEGITGKTKVKQRFSGKNTAIFRLKDPNDIRLTLIKHADSLHLFLPGSTQKIQSIPDGSYQMIFLYRDGSFIDYDLNIKGGILFFKDLSSEEKTPDASQVYLKNLFKTYPKLFSIPLADLPKKLEEENDYQFETFKHPFGAFKYSFLGIQGTIRDLESNEPLIGANIYIKNLGIGTTTDFDGNFQLDAPLGIYDISVSYLGYNDLIINGVPNPYKEPLTIYLSTKGIMLSQVMVREYKVPLIDKDNTTSGQTITSKEIRNKPTKIISALASKAAGLSQVNEGDDVTVRGSRAGAVDYYIDGIRVRGALIPESEIGILNKGKALKLEGSNSTLNPNPLRSQFADYGYFQPRLVTDQNGEAYFNVTYPDNTTRWNNYVIGMNRKKQAGMVTSTTDAYKKVMAQLAIPRFLVAGDEINLIGKSLNYSGDTIPTQTTFTLNGQSIHNNNFSLADIYIDKASLETPTATDSITLTYELTSPTYQDGEKRSIPVLPIGIEETSGIYELLTKDTTLSISFDPSRGPLYIRAETNQINIAKLGLNYLRNYRHECNEQAASKLLAFLWSEKLAIVTKKDFDHKKQIKRLIHLLEKRQNPEGHWSWWTEGDPNYWMTFHIIKALAFANKNGHTTPSIEKALVWMTNEAENLSKPQRLRWLSLMIDIEQNADFEKWIKPLEADWQGKTIHDSLLIAKIKQASNLPFDIDELKSRMKKTLLGDYYFGETYGYRWNSGGELVTTLLAYQIFSQSGESKIAAGLKRYMLRKRSKNYWYNTITTAKIVHGLLSEDFENNGELIRTAELSVDGAPWQKITDTIFQINDFPTAPISFQKRGNTPLYLTAYQQFWNDDPIPKSDVISVITELEQNGKVVENLEANEKTELKVTVKLDALAEYAMIEIPIPASCSYGENARNTWSQNRMAFETHREYFKDRIAIYCRRLPAGTHTFMVDLEPGYSGKFTMNPAKVEMMYFPTFYGRNGLKRIEVR